MTRAMSYDGRSYVVGSKRVLLIVDVGSAISLLRSAPENYQDYVPVYLRIVCLTLRSCDTFPTMKRINVVWNCERRDKYLNCLLEQVKSMIETGIDKPCIAGAIIKGDNEKLND